MKPTEATEEPASPVSGVSLYLRFVGEAWDEPELGRVYRPNALMGGAGVVIGVHRWAQIDFEVAYERMAGQHIDRDSLEPIDKQATLELAPISLLVEGRVPFERGHVYLGAGPTATVFKEEHESFTVFEDESLATSVTSGTKIGAEVRGGVRIDLAVEPVSLELGVGRRFQKDPGLDGGFDLAAWRATAGLGLSF